MAGRQFFPLYIYDKPEESVEDELFTKPVPARHHREPADDEDCQRTSHVGNWRRGFMKSVAKVRTWTADGFESLKPVLRHVCRLRPNRLAVFRLRF